MTTEIDTVRRRHEILDETHVSDENVVLLQFAVISSWTCFHNICNIGYRIGLVYRPNLSLSAVIFL